ncbi:MAG: zf-HC2 domain-containing protein, partial [Verrucomicrobiota bacterium]
MNCQHCSEQLHDYAAAPHSLAAADRLALEAHLTTCPACRAELDSVRRLRAATGRATSGHEHRK